MKSPLACGKSRLHFYKSDGGVADGAVAVGKRKVSLSDGGVAFGQGAGGFQAGKVAGDGGGAGGRAGVAAFSKGDRAVGDGGVAGHNGHLLLAAVAETFPEMLRLEKISSLDRPELEPYRTLKRSGEHAALGIFVIEGDKVFHRLLESHFTLISVLLIEERLAEFEPLLRARPEKEIAVFVCEKNLLTGMVGFELYQGVLAIAKIPAAQSLEKILAASPRPHFFVAMDGLANAENVGALMRNCVALGVQALIAGETCSSLFLRRTVRNSMGALFKLPMLESTNLAQTLHELRAQKIKCIAAHPRADAKILSRADFSGDCCVVFGSEGHGISAQVLAACAEAVTIPMANEVDSLNVSAAAAVFLYEVNRQRGKA